MKNLRLSKDVVPIGEFKSQAAQWLRQLRNTGGPLVITQNGKAAGVLISPMEFDRLREREQFLTSVAKGLADAEAGRLLDSKELKNRLSKLDK